jgi:predicted small integral membrane protein
MSTEPGYLPAARWILKMSSNPLMSNLRPSEMNSAEVESQHKLMKPTQARTRCAWIVYAAFFIGILTTVLSAGMLWYASTRPTQPERVTEKFVRTPRGDATMAAVAISGAMWVANCVVSLLALILRVRS